MYSFPYLKQVCSSISSSICCFLICIQISQEVGQVVWYSHLFKDFPQFVLIHAVKGFGIVNKAETDVFLELSCFFWRSNRCWQFDLWFLCLLSIQFEHLEVLGSHTVEASLGNFEHYFVSIWDDCNCGVAWTFFGIAFLGDWNENWSFPVLWPLLSFSNSLAYCVQDFHSIIF